MADGKPDTDDGWLKIAHELAAALDTAGFGKVERVALNVVFSQTYGRAKRKTAILSPTEIGHRWGYAKQSVERSIKSLCVANVLKKTPGGEYQFNKLYRTWVSGQESRFTKQELEAIGQAPKFATTSSTSTLTVSIPVSADVDTYVSADVDTYSKPVSADVDGPSAPLLTKVSADVDERTQNTNRSARGIEERRNEEGRESIPLRDLSAKTDTTPPRDAEDEAKVDEAIRVLGGNLSCEAVGMWLNRNRNSTEVRAVAGWQFLHAANKLVGPTTTESQKKSFHYFLGTAKKITPDELQPKKTVNRFADTSVPKSAVYIYTKPEPVVGAVPIPEELSRKIRQGRMAGPASPAEIAKQPKPVFIPWDQAPPTRKAVG
jgi:hypothetical protein